MTRRPPSKNHRGASRNHSGAPDVLRNLAWFRYQLRRFLRFSETATRACGVTPQQHQLMLGVAGYTGRGWATISELAEFLQGRHNAVVGLVQRAEASGLVRKEHSARDRRFVRVRLTPAGSRTLRKLANLHVSELERIQIEIRDLARARPQAVKVAKGA